MSGLTLTSATTGGVALDLVVSPAGSALLYLHGGWPSIRPETCSPFLERLARDFSVTAPTHPGFGPDPAPPWLTSIDDLAYLYLDLIRELELSDVTLVGSSLGGWIAATMAVMSCTQIGRIVLVSPLGIKTTDRHTTDLVDIFALTDAELAAAVFADPTSWPPGFQHMGDDEVLLHARSREATARYGWSPYLHEPKLMRRLSRIHVPTLVVFGDTDGVCRPGYFDEYTAAIPGARSATLEGAGHFPHLDVPDDLASAIGRFVVGTRAPATATEGVE